MIPLTSAFFADRGSSEIWISPEHIVAIYCEASGATGILTVTGVVYHVKETPDQISRMWPPST